MATAFVLINSEIGGEDNIISILKRDKLVKEIMMTHGPYDIITKIKTENFLKISEFITSPQLRKLPQIRSILTLIVNNEGYLKMNLKQIS
jgi:DNA-binding Lrp family transcriptional regulator